MVKWIVYTSKHLKMRKTDDIKRVAQNVTIHLNWSHVSKNLSWGVFQRRVLWFSFHISLHCCGSLGSQAKTCIIINYTRPYYSLYHTYYVSTIAQAYWYFSEWELSQKDLLCSEWDEVEVDELTLFIISWHLYSKIKGQDQATVILGLITTINLLSPTSRSESVM